MSKLNVELALKLIPDFDGNADNLHKFLSCCDVVAGSLANTENENFLNLLKTKLSGKAYDVIKYSKFESWEDLKTELKKKFQYSRSIEQLQIQLINVRQQRNESVTIYAGRVEKLLSELNEVCIDTEGAESATIVINLNSKTALKAFQEGLHDSIKTIIKACRFSKLQDAVNQACEEELIISSRNHLSFAPTHNRIKCQICKRNGHSAENCFSRNVVPTFNSARKDIPPYNSSINKPNSSRQFPTIRIAQGTVICAYCKIPGHHISVCRKRQYANAQNKSSFETPKIEQPSFSGNTMGSVPAPKSSTPVRIQEIPK